MIAPSIYKPILDQYGITGGYRNAADLDFSDYNWATAANKIASGDFSWQSVVADFSDISVSNIQLAIDKLTYEKTIISGSTKKGRVQKVIDKLKELKQAKVDNVGPQPYNGPALHPPTYTGGGIGEGGPVEYIEPIKGPEKDYTQYYIWGGVGLGVIVVSTVLYFVLRPTINK